MHFCQQLLRGIKRFLTLPLTKKQSDSGWESERERLNAEEKSRPLINTETRQTVSNVMGDIAGGVGVTGSQGHIGGEGGEGSGPQLNMDPDAHYQIGHVSGGTGGTGGVGVEVGGKGGTGKGPVISMRRSRVL
ncbi:hypothetical protein K438DRAFT_1944826 [Mycena galopus ATCC 62051]|nr:hypothetical protein K438DRAFT_1944826 [Mycena galopus ATCC 62051]